MPSDVVDKTVDAIIAAAYTGETGDGRVFVWDVEQAVRIRTGERGEETVRHGTPAGWGYSMTGPTTAAAGWPRLAAPDRHPPDPPVPPALFRSGVRRPASAIHDHPTTPAAGPAI